MTTSSNDEFCTYDSINRLVNFDRGTLNAAKTAVSGTPAREQDWTLDPTGNWAGFLEATSGTTDLSQSRTHNPVNEITDIAETQGTAWLTPAHDRAGNMTTVPKPSSLANGLSCVYDAWNRLVEVEDTSTSMVVARYEYDGNGHRIKKHLDSQSPVDPDGIDRYEHFYYAGMQCVETRNTTTENDQPESLQPVYQYVWSTRYIDAPVLRDKNTDTDALCDDERLYYLTDANMNVTALVDTSGDAVERCTYSPYGKATIYDATWTNIRSASTYDNQVFYTGRHLDGETGLYFYRARYYSAELGRFIGRDPIGFGAGDLNLYGYTGSSPLLFTDPRGHKKYKFCTRSKTEITIKKVISAKAEALDKDDHITKDEQKMLAVWALQYFKGKQLPPERKDTCNGCTGLKLVMEEDFEFTTFKSVSYKIWIFHGPKGITVNPVKKGWPGEKGPLELKLRILVENKMNWKLLVGCCDEEESSE